MTLTTCVLDVVFIEKFLGEKLHVALGALEKLERLFARLLLVLLDHDERRVVEFNVALLLLLAFTVRLDHRIRFEPLRSAWFAAIPSLSTFILPHFALFSVARVVVFNVRF